MQGFVEGSKLSIRPLGEVPWHVDRIVQIYRHHTDMLCVGGWSTSATSRTTFAWYGGNDITPDREGNIHKILEQEHRTKSGGIFFLEIHRDAAMCMSTIKSEFKSSQLSPVTRIRYFTRLETETSIYGHQKPFFQKRGYDSYISVQKKKINRHTTHRSLI